MALLAGTFFTGCDSADKNAADAKANVKDAKTDLKTAEHDAAVAAQKAADEADWKQFKADSDGKILANEGLVAQLKAKKRSANKAVAAAYQKSIEAVEQKNKELKAKIDGYTRDGKSDWQSFKSEFNHDMEELGHALKDLTVDNKK